MEVQVSSPTDRNEYFLALIKVRKVGEYETGVGREISCYLVGSTDGEFDENAGKKIKIHLCTKSPGTCTHGAVYHCAKSRIVTTEMMDGSHWMSGLTTRIEDLEQPMEWARTFARAKSTSRTSSVRYTPRVVGTHQEFTVTVVSRGND